ncbi:MAG: hypothetical protein AB8B64_02610 [Granulosicoccus sp.]
MKEMPTIMISSQRQIGGGRFVPMEAKIALVSCVSVIHSVSGADATTRVPVVLVDMVQGVFQANFGIMPWHFCLPV